jgi:tricorn protease
LPIPNRSYFGLVAGKANTIYLIEVSQTPGSFGGIVQKYDLDKRKLDKVLDGVSSFDVSANGEKALYRQGQNWVIAATATLGSPVPPGAPGGAHRSLG